MTSLPALSLSGSVQRSLARRRTGLFLAGSIVALLANPSAKAAVITFDGGAAGTSSDLTAPANWSADTLPTTTDEVVFSSVTGTTCSPTTITDLMP